MAVELALARASRHRNRNRLDLGRNSLAQQDN
jgi:hypothetical protein